MSTPLKGNNLCEEHLDFKGDLCPVCLQDSHDKLENALKEIAYRENASDSNYSVNGFTGTDAFAMQIIAKRALGE